MQVQVEYYVRSAPNEMTLVRVREPEELGAALRAVLAELPLIEPAGVFAYAEIHHTPGQRALRANRLAGRSGVGPWTGRAPPHPHSRGIE